MKCAEMTESANDRICERLLISVLPLFEYIVPRLTSATAFGAPLSEIDDRTRRLQTFAAKLLPEVKAIRHLLQDVVEQYASAPKTDSDDYVELLSKVLILFESLVSDDVPGQTVESDLKLGDQKYLKLDALQRCLQAAGRDNNAFASMEHLILLATREKKHEKILSRIIKYNRRLARLVDQDYSTFVLPETEPPKSSPPYEIRDTVNKLYEILLASWQKTCEVPHLAKLRLATFRRLQCPTTDSDVGQDFDLLFSTHAPRRWQQSTVRVCEDGTNKSRSLTFEKKRRGPLRIREPARIESICSVIDHSVTMSSCLLLHFEDEKLLKLAPRSEPKYLPMAAHGPTVSLKTLIESATTFSLKQRRVLAVILSYSLLYVGESQWLRREWTKEDVCFIQTDNNMVDIGRPYLSAEFPGPGINPGIDDETQDCPHPAPSILGLGILLIELEFGKMIESLWKKEDLRNGKKNLNSNITAAMRFLENQRPWDDVYTNFRRAVSACIKGNFLESAEIVDDESFQQAVYTNIVVHLEEELFRGFGIKADALSNTPHHINLHCNTSVDSVKSLETFETETTLFKGEISLCTRPTFKFLHDFGSDFEQESDFRVFDSVLMSGPESNAKAALAKMFFHNLREIGKLLGSGRSEGDIPVRVAILDTGIDPLHPLVDKIRDYRDFIDKQCTLEQQLPKDNTGHGTNMVHLLHKTAPFVEIYVARVFSEDTGNSETALNIAEAIIYARDTWKVDIISMSFGFKDEHPKLAQEINDTHQTLMFAASSNFGANEDPPIRFPARVKDRVICINASDGNGHPSDPNPPFDITRSNFSILGEGVPLGKRVLPDSQGPQMVYGRGTSMATPIAAGVAALVLEFSRQGGIHKKIEGAESLKTYAGMSSVLRAMTRAGQKGGFNFIAPAKVLLGDVKKSESQRMGEICESISKALREKYH